MRRNPRRAEEMQASRQGELDSLVKRTDQANDFLTGHPRAKVATALKSLQNHVAKLKLTAWVSIGQADDRREVALRIIAKSGIAMLRSSNPTTPKKPPKKTPPEPRKTFLKNVFRSISQTVLKGTSVPEASGETPAPPLVTRFSEAIEFGGDLEIV